MIDLSALINFDQHSEHIAILTLNRPRVANALSTKLLDELNETIDHINQDENIRSVIITGAGDKVFCAGADLKEREQMSETEVVQAVKYIGHTINRIEKIEVPTIAAINGVAFGGGLELALACDLRVVAEGALLGLTETSLAIIPGAGGTQRLARLIGIGQAKRLIFTAESINGKEAYHLGLAEYMTADNVVETAKTISKTIASNGPIAMKQAKLAIDQGSQVDLTTGLTIEHLAYEKTIPTEDRLEGIRSFQEKRQANYKGK